MGNGWYAPAEADSEVQAKLPRTTGRTGLRPYKPAPPFLLRFGGVLYFMYLYIWRNGTAKQVPDNPTVIDCLAVKQGTLSIFRFCDGFQRLSFNNSGFLWVDVINSDLIKTSSDRLNV